MRLLVRWIARFFVYSNIFISLCAVVMVNQTCNFLLHTDANVNYLLFVFFSTLCSYSFHWFLTSTAAFPSPRIEWVNRNRIIYVVFFFAGVIGAAVFFFYLLPYWEWLLLSAVITFLYSAPKIPHPIFRLLRKVALGKTIFLAFVWMHVTTILPIIISNQPFETADFLFIVSRFFLIYAICILFDYRDREDDKAAGIRSLITFLNERAIAWLFFGSLIIFAIATLLLLQYGHSTLQVIVLIIPGILTAGFYSYAKQNFSDIFYYLILDGLMALSATIMLIPGI